MIKFNDILIKQQQFGDGTLKCEVPEMTDNYIDLITWCYDNDAELFTLWSLVNQIRDIKGPDSPIKLFMPYIPHARQDRNVSNRLFTLKYFAKVLNLMNFDSVEVLDPHSDVSAALINNIVIIPGLMHCFGVDADYVTMFPDNGAAKKYSASDNVIIGNKHRNAEGRIEKYELTNFKNGTKKVLIVDDICSYGGTFVAAAKALRERGVEKIDLCVSHCESNIFKGEVFDYVDRVYTTDSLLDFENRDYEGYSEEKKDKIKFVKMFRKTNN